MGKCMFCDKTLVGRSDKKFCSPSCKDKFRYRFSRREEVKCSRCGDRYQRPKFWKVGSSILCRSCSTKRMMAHRNQEGPANPAWKGGTKQWQAGKLGRDKAHLSWKAQRKLAWERDAYTCQHCGKCKPGWKPDVHHISPYRLSFSHSLVNLLSLCRSCHKKLEAKETTLWGGKSFGGNLRDGHYSRVFKFEEVCSGCFKVRKLKDGLCRGCHPRKPRRRKVIKDFDRGCSYCGSLSRKLNGGACLVCRFLKVTLPKVKEYRVRGLSCVAIAGKLGVSHQSVSLWLRR